MKPESLFSPICLRYVAALRGFKPPKTGVEFSYAEAACTSPENLICLAASNPEGRFYGLVADDTARKMAEDMASERGTFNVIFLTGLPSETLKRLTEGSSLPPMLDYLCCNESETALPAAERAALFDLADKRLNPGGLLVTSYCVARDEEDSLRFLVQELLPEMTPQQKEEFLVEIKKLGASFLAKHPDTETALSKAMAQKKPELFFSLFEGRVARSATFDTMVQTQSRGFAYAGDALLSSNFVELTIPPEAQDLIVACRNNPLYEPIKDFALNRAIRSDIWIKTPCEQGTTPPELFGGFAYGLIVPREQIPPAFKAKGKMIDLSEPLYLKVIDLMSIMPIGVGDVKVHASGRDENPEKILEVFQILVACGFALPMRGALTEMNIADSFDLHLVGNFNRYLDKMHLTDKDILFASQITGFGLVLPVQEAFVMQAINRAGLNDSITALIPELYRLANTPASQNVINADEPTAEIVVQMVRDIVKKSLPQWCALALLEAA